MIGVAAFVYWKMKSIPKAKLGFLSNGEAIELPGDASPIPNDSRDSTINDKIVVDLTNVSQVEINNFKD